MDIQQQFNKVIDNINSVLVGKEDTAKMLFAGILARGHILVEDKPGVGKTMLAKILARSLNCKYSRIQFNADTLPSDITGMEVYNVQQGFKFVPGPIMANLVLVDEINRGNPRAQSGLLEAMEERQVTVGESTYRLDEPFCVIATQNPLDLAGTFPLGEGLLDRFMLRLSLGYPSREEELRMLELWSGRAPIASIEPVISAEQLLLWQEAVREVYVEHSVRQYVVDLVQRLRILPEVRVGVSPRATLDIFILTRAWALLHGRNYVLPDDVKSVARGTLIHRVFVKDEAAFTGQTPEKVVEEALIKVPVPVAGRST